MVDVHEMVGHVDEEAPVEELREEVRLAGRPRLPVRLGSVRLAGRVERGRGIGVRGLRASPEHELLYVTGGRGGYVDGRTHIRHPVVPGSLVVACAGVPHWYGPPAGETWDLYFMTVEGPLFTLARSEGLLDPDRPVRGLVPMAYWAGRFAVIQRARPPRSVAGLEDEACRVLQLLVEIGSGGGDPAPTGGGSAWLDTSRELLEGDLGAPLDLPAVAAAVGMPYETWRKQFRRAVGTTPGRYRAERKVDAARDLLRYSSLSLHEIAEETGFADEHHLSRRFRGSTGIAPREFRRRPG